MIRDANQFKSEIPTQLQIIAIQINLRPSLKMKPCQYLHYILCLVSGVLSQQLTYQNTTGTRLRVDNGTYGPPVEEVHYFYDQWPVGFAVSSKGRIFASYFPGNYTYTLGEVVNATAERPYPGPEWNVPPSEISEEWDGILFGSNNDTGFIAVQALYVTPQTDNRPETLWVLDVGRPTVGNTGQMAYARPGMEFLVPFSLLYPPR